MSSVDLTAAAVTDDVIAGSSSHFLLSSTGLFNEKVKELDPDEARAQFLFYFFAGSGAGGIGLTQIPKLFQEIQELKDLSLVGPSQGGEALNVGPLVSIFYSPPLYEKDVVKVISQMPNSAATISAQGTSTSYMASMGYVVQSDFVATCKGCNPYAASAVFEAMSGGKAKCIQPDDVDAKTNLYKQSSGGDGGGLTSMVQDLQGAAATRLGAIGTLAFLLFLIFSLIVESGLQAFT